MESIENTFSDNKGNHLMVALDFCDKSYKQETLQIPEEYSDIEIVDINIEKVYLDKPINSIVFFKMSSWLLQQFLSQENAIFCFICSTDELENNHPTIKPQMYRWSLFDKLYQRMLNKISFNIQDVIVGPEGYQTFGRAFYRDKHAPILHLVVAHLKEKQHQ